MNSSLNVPPWPSNTLEEVRQCPVCDSFHNVLLYKGIFDRINSAPGLWSLKRCCSCYSCFLDPRPNRVSIGRAYDSYYTHVATNPASAGRDVSFFQRLRNGYLNKKYGTGYKYSSPLGPLVIQLIPFLKARADYVFRYLPPSKGLKPTFLEIGCGNGTFLKQMEQTGWHAIGIEPDPHACTAARQLGLDIIEGFLEGAGLQTHSFDAISMNHVIEHLHDPIQTLRLCRSMLKPGGCISIITPNVNSLASKIFKNDWYALHPPCHLCLFTRKSLVFALRQAGFAEIRIHPSNTYALPASCAASLNNKPRLSSSQFLDKILLLPGVLKLLQYLTWVMPFLGEEAVVTAKAPI